MPTYAFILGRNPQLARLELERLLSDTVSVTQPLPDVLLAELPKLENPFALQNRLGGTLKIVEITDSCDPAELPEKALAYLTAIQKGKDFAVSWYGSGYQRQLPYNLKKQLSGWRLVLPKEGAALSTAQTFHNHLARYKKNGEPQERTLELGVINVGQKLCFGPVLTVQNIDSYAKRDFGIPQPDSLSGMLPPKLAQMLINLGVGPDTQATVYDPFCGNGRLLAEARLMGFPALGSDLEEKKVAASRANLEWYVQTLGIELERPLEEIVWQQDARQAAKVVDPVIITEPYLGRPLRTALRGNEGEGWVSELMPLYLDFLKVWSSKAPKKMIVIFPKARQENKPGLSLFARLVDRLSEMGYASTILACYERPDAFVAREIVELTHRT